jgi:hypothetical protein
MELIYLDALHLSDYVLSTYRRSASKLPVNLYVAWYDSQRKGASAHSPRSCLPGGGWQIEAFDTIDVAGLGARYALRRIAHRTNDDGAVVSCADAPDVLRGKRRRTIELHEHAACATCHRAIRKKERTAVPPRAFFPRLVVCNLCPSGRAVALWDGTRLAYESATSSLRPASETGGAESAESHGAFPRQGAASVEPNAVRAALEVMIAVLLAIERGASGAGLAARARSVPLALLRLGFESLLAPFE